ncbi:MAG TPA: hypothetical protein PKD98_08195 [Anaerolineae bacterium]|nr:hypothetical protein [Anaerolineae bacterium]
MTMNRRKQDVTPNSAAITPPTDPLADSVRQRGQWGQRHLQKFTALTGMVQRRPLALTGPAIKSLVQRFASSGFSPKAADGQPVQRSEAAWRQRPANLVWDGLEATPDPAQTAAEEAAEYARTFPYSVTQIREALDRHQAGLPPVTPPRRSESPAIQRQPAADSGPANKPALPFTVAQVRDALDRMKRGEPAAPDQPSPAPPVQRRPAESSPTASPPQPRTLAEIQRALDEAQRNLAAQQSAALSSQQQPGRGQENIPTIAPRRPRQWVEQMARREATVPPVTPPGKTVQRAPSEPRSREVEPSKPQPPAKDRSDQAPGDLANPLAPPDGWPEMDNLPSAPAQSAPEAGSKPQPAKASPVESTPPSPAPVTGQVQRAAETQRPVPPNEPKPVESRPAEAKIQRASETPPAPVQQTDDAPVRPAHAGPDFAVDRDLTNFENLSGLSETLETRSAPAETGPQALTGAKDFEPEAAKVEAIAPRPRPVETNTQRPVEAPAAPVQRAHDKPVQQAHDGPVRSAPEAPASMLDDSGPDAFDAPKKIEPVETEVQRAPDAPVRQAHEASVTGSDDTGPETLPGPKKIELPVAAKPVIQPPAPADPEIQRAVDAPVRPAPEPPVRQAHDTPVQQAPEAPVQQTYETPASLPDETVPETAARPRGIDPGAAKPVEAEVQRAVDPLVRPAPDAPVRPAPQAPVQQAHDTPAESHIQRRVEDTTFPLRQPVIEREAGDQAPAPVEGQPEATRSNSIAVLPQVRRQSEPKREQTDHNDEAERPAARLPLVWPKERAETRGQKESATPVYSSPAVQRAVEAPSPATAPEPVSDPTPSLGTIQRFEETAPVPSASEAKPEAANLDRLARQVYPLVKQMLAVERERRPFR